MGTLIKLLMHLWPFIREMISKDKESQQFVERNKHSLYITTAAAVLFLLFCNSFIKNVQFSQMIVEARKDSAYYKERLDEINANLAELKGEHVKVRSALFTCIGLPELMMVDGNHNHTEEPSQPARHGNNDAVITPPSTTRKRLDGKEHDLIN